MASLLDFAELLVAAWLLSGKDPAVPTSHGVLDRALAQAFKKGAFPAWKDQLHFVESRVGLQCVELADVLTWAQRAEFTTVPNPSYQTTKIKISRAAALELLRRHGVTEGDATKWGELLHEEVARASEAA